MYPFEKNMKSSQKKTMKLNEARQNQTLSFTF